MTQSYPYQLGMFYQMCLQTYCSVLQKFLKGVTLILNTFGLLKQKKKFNPRVWVWALPKPVATPVLGRYKCGIRAFV